MSRQHSQRGMSMYGMLVVTILVVYFALTAVKLGPVYFDDYQIRKVLESVAHDVGANNTSKSQIKESISKRLNINNISYIDQKDILILEEKAGASLQLEYEVRVPMFYNVDALVKFSHQVPLKPN